MSNFESYISTGGIIVEAGESLSSTLNLLIEKRGQDRKDFLLKTTSSILRFILFRIILDFFE